ncbi:hypothetical protein [Brucella intermedia]|uniref:hypothetical protein n=1 Tax=Brucella intermedia TaxID=94625 RepID=UPI00124DE14A|nr:hypothetical protein [Brucella intermedia]KAB2715201.1 hypothetical protein F9K75_19320 [Brucella intermedia]
MNTNVITADIRYRDWLISHDPHVPAHWVKRCLSAGEYIIALADAAPVGFLRYSWFWGVHRSNGFREAGAISFGKFQPQSEVFLIKDL